MLWRKVTLVLRRFTKRIFENSAILVTVSARCQATGSSDSQNAILDTTENAIRNG